MYQNREGKTAKKPKAFIVKKAKNADVSVEVTEIEQKPAEPEKKEEPAPKAEGFSTT